MKQCTAGMIQHSNLTLQTVAVNDVNKDENTALDNNLNMDSKYFTSKLP